MITWTPATRRGKDTGPSRGADDPGQPDQRANDPDPRHL